MKQFHGVLHFPLGCTPRSHFFFHFFFLYKTDKRVGFLTLKGDFYTWPLASR